MQNGTLNLETQQTELLAKHKAEFVGGAVSGLDIILPRVCSGKL